jgi:hypothetical protein
MYINYGKQENRMLTLFTHKTIAMPSMVPVKVGESRSLWNFEK